MWKRIKDFYSSNKYAIWWTAGYVAACWAIMRYMFNFNIFSATRWNQLWHAHLYGFAGFVFGILILAMIPLYIATTIVIARTHAPLFNFKITIPTFIKTYIKNAFTQTPIPSDAPTVEKNESVQVTETNDSDPQKTNENESPALVPETVPSELRVAYMRARDNISRTQPSAFDLANTSVVPAPITEPTPATAAPMTDFSIPTDFDIADTNDIIGDTPTFTDINFDDEIDLEEEDTNTPNNDEIKNLSDTNDAVVKYLGDKSIPFEIIDDVVATDKFAIASHTDSDFWVADTESWFAAGKIRKSPIVSVQSIAAARNLEPVLYLGADNIMDIDELRAGWKSAGIRVISDLDELK